MEKTWTERRTNCRYGVHLHLQYHLAVKGEEPRSGTSTTCDMSTSGICFRTRRPLPVGAHIEIVVEWPAKYRDYEAVDLQITGFVLRSESGKSAVRITSWRFRVDSVSERVRATA